MSDTDVKSSYWINTIIRLDDGTYLVKGYHCGSGVTNWSSFRTFEEVVDMMRVEYGEEIGEIQ